MGVLHAAIPLFLLLIGAEALAARRAGRRTPSLRCSLSNAACGGLDEIATILAVGGFAALYGWLEGTLGILDVPPSSPWSWLALVVLADLSYYARHRASHRVAVLWAAHVVHHQSPEYNLTVSLRQGIAATWVAWAFYLPLALLGFPFAMFAAVEGAYQVYQFLVHTPLVGRLGPLEWLLITPSLHRVHHGSAPHHVDRNFGGLFNLWDRLFGTLQPEDAEPTYGIGGGMPRDNPLWANTHAFVALARASARAPRLRDKVAVLLAPP